MLKLVTAKTSNIVSIEDAQNHLKVDSDTDIAYVESLIYMAENYLNAIADRSYIQETFDLFLDDFCPVTYFTIAPIASITSVKYYDSDDAQQTLVLNTDYYQDIISEPGYIVAVGDNWPSVYDKPNAVEIRIVTGVVSPEIVPIEYKQAALLLIGDAYKNREDQIRRHPTAVDRLIYNLRLNQ